MKSCIQISLVSMCILLCVCVALCIFSPLLYYPSSLPLLSFFTLSFSVSLWELTWGLHMFNTCPLHPSLSHTHVTGYTIPNSSALFHVLFYVTHHSQESGDKSVLFPPWSAPSLCPLETLIYSPPS